MKAKPSIPPPKQRSHTRRKIAQARGAPHRAPSLAEPSPSRFTVALLLPEHASQGSSRAVTLRLHALQAERVILSGSFNNWALDEYEMHQNGDGWWVAELSLPPGRYEYRFVVDGEWTNGSSPDGYVRNPFGTTNCVLVVT